jgi:hypothetical protein
MAGILVHTPFRDRIKAITRFLDPGLTGIFGLDDRLGRRQHGRLRIARRGWRSRRYASAACCGG